MWYCAWNLDEKWNGKMSIYSKDEEEEKIYQRQINLDVQHAIQHIKAKQYEFAINMLKEALKREKKAKRNNDT